MVASLSLNVTSVSFSLLIESTFSKEKAKGLARKFKSHPYQAVKRWL
jgi:hypothetical protein